tara:strand:- start:262 stop:657 length:396 start_codon:yes stop_codon:yes gene_type:complete
MFPTIFVFVNFTTETVRDFDPCHNHDGSFVRRPEDVVAALENGTAREIDSTKWEMSVDGSYDHILGQEPGFDHTEWQVVGIYDCDKSGFCPIEGKFEYYVDIRYLLIPKSAPEVDSIDLWEDRAEALGYWA